VAMDANALVFSQILFSEPVGSLLEQPGLTAQRSAANRASRMLQP
jgi:hypothetical protein